jgi:acetaldehyde dehydrogenase (acetylating)
MSNFKVLLVLLARVMNMSMQDMSMSMQDMIGIEATEDGITKDGTTEDGTTDGVMTGMMNIPDIGGITITAIVGLRIPNSGFYVSSVASTWPTQI